MVDGERVEGTTKVGRERTVSIDAGTVEALKAHRRKQMEDQLTAGDAWVGVGHVFTNGLGTPIYPTSPTQLMAKTIKAHNEPKDVDGKPVDPPAVPLPHMRFHDLRHVHATMLLLAGVPVHVVAERLGHADPSITLRVYAHVIRERAAEVADIFAHAVEPEDEGSDASEPAPC